MDIRKVKKLIELLEQSGISEIEITEGDDAVRISRYPSSTTHAPIVATPTIVTAAAPPTETVPPASSTPVAAAEPPATTPEEAVIPDGHRVTAPMVGTYYDRTGETRGDGAGRLKLLITKVFLPEIFACRPQLHDECIRITCWEAALGVAPVESSD